MAPGAFPPTRWSAILGLQSGDDAERARSFDALVAAYWKPVYKYARLRWNRSPEESQDLAQEFFLRALEKDFFSDYEPARARFRTYLRFVLDRFLANEAKAAGRIKRGGAVTFVALDLETAEAEIAASAAAGVATGGIAGTGVAGPSVEETFDRDWARALLEAAVRSFRAECDASGRSLQWSVFERYDLCSTPDARPTYDAIAREFDVPATTVTNHLASARRALRRHVLDALRAITASEAEYREEARFLLGHDPESSR